MDIPKRRSTLKNKSFLIPIMIVLVAGLVFGGCTGPGPAPEVKTLEIGYADALTGFGSESTAVSVQAGELLAEMINERGGITIKGQKYQIKVIPQDTKQTADGTVAAVTTLVHDRNVKFIVGPIMPAMIMAANTVTEPAGVLHVSAFNCADPGELGPETPYTFVGNAGPAQSNPVILKHLHENFPNLKSIVWILEESGSQYLWPIFEQVSEELGFTSINAVTWTPSEVDFAPIITKTLTFHPDVIAAPLGWPQIFGTMVKLSRDQGFTGPFFNGSTNAEDIIQIAGEEAAAGYYSIAFSASDIDDPKTPDDLKAFVEKCTDKFGIFQISHHSGGNVIYVLLEAIDAAQSLDPTVVRDTWEEMGDFQTLYGTGHLGGLKTYGINHLVCYPSILYGLGKGGEKEIREWVEVGSP
jgi:branched-chain amino acid transport system substrate-binding protein